jgi:hypothetical protein
MLRSGYWQLVPVLRIRDVYPGFEFLHPGSRIQGPDYGNWYQCCGSEMFIPDSNFFHPGSRIQGQRDFGSRIQGQNIPDPGSGSATFTDTPVHLGEGGMGVAGEKDHPRLTPGVHYSLLKDTTQHK